MEAERPPRIGTKRFDVIINVQPGLTFLSSHPDEKCQYAWADVSIVVQSRDCRRTKNTQAEFKGSDKWEQDSLVGFLSSSKKKACDSSRVDFWYLPTLFFKHFQGNDRRA